MANSEYHPFLRYDFIGAKLNEAIYDWNDPMRIIYHRLEIRRDLNVCTLAHQTRR
jgi:hypothetical protein